ncbi:hypothetical protein SAMN04490207_6191 [Pseudomonas gessardii]|uniref:hypothetical protein n=1 Tax=Pseudomonas gessardii TaxID=78544 RepID=UPI000890BC02|nr:hypothetical protein [Pseudomonas gessardii]MRU54308.1 hypothetical protein [Pseudomonas gessardii]ONH35969.1 hypothetical protein BLL38_28205 [Pseudomonas gessardii]SDR41184.1 hypothetical protein SAMN04490207_6191 [Pseudomonas gessardii]
MTDKMREEFEEWAFQCPWLGLSDECMARDEINGGYYGLELHAAWLAWQASREALVIELPDYTSPYYGGDHFDECQYAADCEKAIEAAGLKVKP